MKLVSAAATLGDLLGGLSPGTFQLGGQSGKVAESALLKSTSPPELYGGLTWQQQGLVGPSSSRALLRHRLRWWQPWASSAQLLRAVTMSRQVCAPV